MFSKVKRYVGLLMLAVVMVLGVAQQAAAQVTLPTLGIDTQDYVDALVTYAGVFLGVALTGYFAFIAIRMFTRWVKTLIANA